MNFNAFASAHQSNGALKWKYCISLTSSSKVLSSKSFDTWVAGAANKQKFLSPNSKVLGKIIKSCSQIILSFPRWVKQSVKATLLDRLGVTACKWWNLSPSPSTLPEAEISRTTLPATISEALLDPLASLRKLVRVPLALQSALCLHKTRVFAIRPLLHLLWVHVEPVEGRVPALTTPHTFLALHI